MTTTQTDTSIAQRLTKARTALLLDHPWFGSLALRLRLEEKPGLGTCATDGTHLLYDPAFVATLSGPELQGVIAHEVLHCALLHVFRVGARNRLVWNIAADLAINPMIVDAGMTLPAGCLLDRQYANMSAEEIYARILNQAEKIAQGQRPGQKPGEAWGIGEDIKDPPKATSKPGDAPGKAGDDADGNTPADTGADDDTPRRESDWQIDVEQISNATKKAGKVPAGIMRQVEKARQSRTDWRTLLHRFIEQNVPSDYSWAHPNRRYVATGQYLPGQVKENFPRIGIGVDTSGSIGNRELAVVSAELDSIMRELRPECLEVVYCDAQVAGVELFDPDGPTLRLHPKGGGGTAFQPVFDYFAKSGEPPACVIYFTDLYGPAPKDPGYPVLWVTSERSQQEHWFGELIRVELD